MEWLYLLIAGILEVAWAVFMKMSDGFTKVMPSIITGIGYIASAVFLALALRKLPLGTAYAMWTGYGDKKVGGAVIRIDGTRGDLDLLFTSPKVHSKGIGYAAWREIESLHPEVEVWETVTPYFETRNIHFYVNRCGFHIVEYYNRYHKSSRRDDSA